MCLGTCRFKCILLKEKIVNITVQEAALLLDSKNSEREKIIIIWDWKVLNIPLLVQKADIKIYVDVHGEKVFPKDENYQENEYFDQSIENADFIY